MASFSLDIAIIMPCLAFRNETFSESRAQSQPSSEELMYRFMEMLETGEGSMGGVYEVGAPSQGANSMLRGGEGGRKHRGH